MNPQQPTAGPSRRSVLKSTVTAAGIAAASQLVVPHPSARRAVRW